MTDSIRNAKAALEEGLISDGEFAEVKNAFLRAQQIKAGLEAGFIKEADFEQVKSAFLQSLSLSVSQTPVVPLPESTNGAVQQYVSQTSSAQPTRSPPRSAAAASPVPQPSPVASSKRAPLIPTNIPKSSSQRSKNGNAGSLSGISVAEDAVNLYYYIKAKSAYRWAMWKVNDSGTEVVTCDAGEKDSPYSDFLAALPPADCRYGVFDFQLTNSEGSIRNKLVFISWSPDTARIKSKMMYASTKDYFKGFLDGISIEMQASDLDDITEKEIVDSVLSVMTRG